MVSWPAAAEPLSTREVAWVVVDFADCVGFKLSKPAEEVGVNGLPNVGEVGSFEPDESFVRFFLRKPSDGIEK
jgi:hypothetical protein